MNSFVRILGLFAAVLPAVHALAETPPGPPAGELSSLTVRPFKEASQTANLMYNILLAEVAAGRDQMDLALEHYRMVALVSDDPRIAERAMTIALLRDDYPAALELGRRWFALDGGNSRARQALTFALLNTGLADEAVTQLEAIRASTDEDGQDGFTAVAVIMNQVPDRALALRVMEGLRKLHANSRYALYYYAGAALAANDMDKALEGANATLAQDPKWSSAHILLARVKMAMKDNDGAMAGLATAVAAAPEDRFLRMGYARLLVGAGRLDEARNQFLRVTEQNPQDAEPFFALGLLASEQKRYDEAVGHFNEVLKRGTRTMETYYEMGRIEEQRGDFQKAKDWYAKVSDDERYLSAQVRVGAMFAKLGDFTGMTEHFSKVRRLNPQSEVALYISEADVLRDEKRHQEAFNVLSRALDQYTGNEELLYSRALAAEKIDRLDVLEKDLRAIIATNPKHGHALNALGYTLADRTDRYQEALGYIQQAIALLPDDAAVVDSMGWVQYRLGNKDEALKHLRRAYEMNPDPEIGSHLVEVLWVTGRQDEARQLFQQATEKNPDSDHLRKVKERLKL